MRRRINILNDNTLIKSFGNVIRFFLLLFLTAEFSVSEAAVGDRMIVVTNSEYGAIADDGVDDTAAFQSALDDLALTYSTDFAGNHSGVALFVPEGDYNISERLVFVTTNNPSQGGGIMIRGEGASKSVLITTNSNPSSDKGALFFDLFTDTGDDIWLQIEDIGFLANEADAGPAIEIDSTLTNAFKVKPVVRNVSIRRLAPVSNGYTYGFKGRRMGRPLLDDVLIKGNANDMIAAVYLEETYAHNIKDVEVNGAVTGIHHYIGGEGNMINRVDISNVQTGIVVNIKRGQVAMSNSNGTLLNSIVSASKCGLSVYNKRFFFVSNNTFLSEAGNGDYCDVKMGMCQNCMITANSFSGGGTNRTGICFYEGEAPDLSGVTIVSDNTLSSLNTGVEIEAGVKEIMVFDNLFSNTVAEVQDNGVSTFYRAGSPNCIIPPTAVKDSEVFSWGDDQGELFDVTDYGAIGNGRRDDTVSIQSALDSLKSYLNNGSNRRAVLYFPPGTFMVSNTLSLIQGSSDSLWGQVAIHGEGMSVSVMECVSGSTNGLFDLDFNHNSVRVDIHNMRLVPRATCAGIAVCVQQPNVSSERSFYMHNIRMARRASAANDCFTTCVKGEKLADPFFENVFIEMFSTGGYAAGTTGIWLEDGRGFMCDKMMIKKALETGLKINSIGGDILIKNTTGFIVDPHVGALIDAGGGRVAIDAAHISTEKINLDVSNASAVWFMNTETLNLDDSSNTTGRATVRLRNCQSAWIQNNVFKKSTPEEGWNTLRRVVWLDGSSNREVNVVGNIFKEPAGASVYVASGSVDTDVSDNRFASVDSGNSTGLVPATALNDIEDFGTGTTVCRTYELNGEADRFYTLENMEKNGLLDLAGLDVDCGGNPLALNDGMQWKVVYQGDGYYSLESKEDSGQYLYRDGDEVDCTGTSVVNRTKWVVVNRDDNLYTVKRSFDSKFLHYEAVDDDVDGLGTSIDDDTCWLMTLLDE